MNYIWEVILKAREQKIKDEEINFIHAKEYCAYLELAFDILNEEYIEKNKSIEINPYLRFNNIFNEFNQIKDDKNHFDKEKFFNEIIHILAKEDLKKGINKKELYKKFILDDINNSCFGSEIKETFNKLNIKEREYILNGLLTLYRTGDSLTLLCKLIRKLFSKSIIYRSNDNPKLLLIYIGIKQTPYVASKINLVLDLFMCVEYEVVVYWDKHFGILGINETMHIDELIINEGDTYVY